MHKTPGVNNTVQAEVLHPKFNTSRRDVYIVYSVLYRSYVELWHIRICDKNWYINRYMEKLAIYIHWSNAKGLLCGSSYQVLADPVSTSTRIYHHPLVRVEGEPWQILHTSNTCDGFLRSSLTSPSTKTTKHANRIRSAKYWRNIETSKGFYVRID